MVGVHLCYRTRMTAFGWKILLIGGGTGAGKTELSRALAKRFDANVMEGDDLRWAIEAAVPRGSDPDLHLFVDADVWQLPVEELVDRTERLSARICRAAEAVVSPASHARATLHPRCVLGPAVVCQPTELQRCRHGRRCPIASSSTRDDGASMAERRAARERDARPATPEAARLAMFRAHGALMRRQAEALGLPVLASRPLETLEARALAALGEAVFLRRERWLVLRGPQDERARRLAFSSASAV